MRRWVFNTVLVLCLSLLPKTAGATLLFSGGEDVDFVCAVGGSCGVDTTSGRFRSAWARSAYQVLGEASDPPVNRFGSPVFTPSSALWVHAQFCTLYINGGACVADTSANNQMLRVLDSNGNAALVVRGTGALGQVKISSRSASGAFTDLVTCPAAAGLGVWQFDFFVNYSTSGEVALFNNGIQVCDYTGNVTNGDGATTLNKAEFGSPRVAAGGNNYAGDWSEVIIATTDTRAMSRFTANTVANGNTVGFSGTNVCSAIWNATVNNDTNYGYSGTSNTTHECTIKSSIPAGSYNVLALVMSARALAGTSGPQHFDFVTRIGGTDYTSDDYAPLPAFSNISNYMQTINPATSNPWAVSDFTAAGFNVGEMTKP
ncbi:hypothetical protein O7A70_30290 [Mesorhizobium sp. Cs1299R1N1]|uniref:hypothetical protein n=1 Tax=Mesorhizobium sp. Cs1299R1N1 TaxID=3015172 RepID=UPI00301CB7B6